jgi:hypothetical protein
MEINQALSILSQAMDLAVGSGAFKASKDVAVIEAAKETLVKYVTGNETIKQLGNEEESPKDIGPKKAK